MKPRPFAWPMGLILAALAFLSFCPGKAHPQVAPVIAGMSTEEDVVKHLEQLADTAKLEHARCLTGYLRDSLLVIDGVAEAPWLMSNQTDSSVALRWWDCPRGTVALWHNHVPAWTAAHYGPSAPVCFLGRGDAGLLRRKESPPVQLVSVRVGLTCTFVRLPSGELVQAETVR